MANRRESIPGYLYALDGLRALSLIMIYIFHAWQQSWIHFYIKLPGGTTLDFLTQMQRYGYIAIDSFFVLSGFCLFYPIARSIFGNGKDINWKEFYIKRIKRILPSYVLLIILMWFIADLPALKMADFKNYLKHFFAFLTFTQNRSGGTYGSLISTAWTLAIEVQFYLVFPFIVKAFRKKPILTYVVSLVICQALRIFAVTNYDAANIIQGHMIFYIDIFVMGMLCSYFVVYAKNKLPHMDKLKIPMTIASALFVLLAYYYMRWMGSYRVEGMVSPDAVHRFIYRPILYFAVAGFIFTACFSIKFWERGIWGNRVSMFLSTISYNFYLWHQNIHIYFKRNPVEFLYTMADAENHVPGPMLKFMIFTGGLSLVIAILVTYLFEIPISKYGLVGYFKNIGKLFKKNQKKA